MIFDLNFKDNVKASEGSVRREIRQANYTNQKGECVPRRPDMDMNMTFVRKFEIMYQKWRNKKFNLFGRQRNSYQVMQKKRGQEYLLGAWESLYSCPYRLFCIATFSVCDWCDVVLFYEHATEIALV